MISSQYPQSSFLSAPQFWHLLLNSDIWSPAEKNVSFGDVKHKKIGPNFQTTISQEVLQRYVTVLYKTVKTTKLSLSKTFQYILSSLINSIVISNFLRITIKLLTVWLVALHCSTDASSYISSQLECLPPKQLQQGVTDMWICKVHVWKGPRKSMIMTNVVIQC